MSMPRVPILVILGATGSGKSRLAIELAHRFSGEIISADSMQVYKGLDIVTAKVTPVERKAAPHHMLDIVDPLTNFSVIDFRNMALPIIDNLLARRKLPIVVGGTNYYIESLLWEILITDPKEPSMQVNSSATNSSTSIENRSDDRYNVQDRLNDSDDDDDEMAPKKLKFDARIYDGSNEELHQKLMKIDPEMAFKLHPNNRRKVIRSLEIFYQHGKTQSELLKVQRIAGGCGLGGPLKYPNIIMLWLRCNKKILDNRLNDRVDGMMEVGLVQELLDFHRSYNEQRIKSNTSPDYTKGIFQSIGFKEFHTYLILPEKERASEKVNNEHEMICRYKLSSAIIICLRNCFSWDPQLFSAVKMHDLQCNLPCGHIAISLSTLFLFLSTSIHAILTVHRRFLQAFPILISRELSKAIDLDDSRLHLLYNYKGRRIRNKAQGKKLLQQGIDDLKLATRRYAKRQDKWVMNRLIRRGDRQVPPIYSLDCTDVTKWDSHVLEPAAAIISAILHDAKPEQQPLNENFENQKTTDSSTNIYNYCKVCERVFVEEHQWQAHLKGGKHMKILKKKKKIAEDTHSRNVN